MLKDRLYIGLVLFIVVLCEATFLNAVRIGGAKPDILLLSVLFFGLAKRGGWGFGTGLAAGTLKGLFSLSWLGVNLLVLAAVGLIIDYQRDKLYSESRLTQILLSGSAAFLAGTGYYIFTRLFAGTPLAFAPSLKLILLVSLYTTAIAPLFFTILSRLFRVER